LNSLRHWIYEYSALARGGETEGGATANRTFETPTGPVATRLYNPEQQVRTLVFVHGGGWVMGGIESHDHIARWLAAETGTRVIQIEYRLAPQHPDAVVLEPLCAAAAARSAGQETQSVGAFIHYQIRHSPPQNFVLRLFQMDTINRT